MRAPHFAMEYLAFEALRSQPSFLVLVSVRSIVSVQGTTRCQAGKGEGVR
jgi:hypothetical protein